MPTESTGTGTSTPLTYNLNNINVDTVENCNLIYHIEKGKIVKEGSPDSILAKEITAADWIFTLTKLYILI